MRKLLAIAALGILIGLLVLIIAAAETWKRGRR